MKDRKKKFLLKKCKKKTNKIPKIRKRLGRSWGKPNQTTFFVVWNNVERKQFNYTTWTLYHGGKSASNAWCTIMNDVYTSTHTIWTKAPIFCQSLPSSSSSPPAITTITRELFSSCLTTLCTPLSSLCMYSFCVWYSYLQTNSITYPKKRHYIYEKRHDFNYINHLKHTCVLNNTDSLLNMTFLPTWIIRKSVCIYRQAENNIFFMKHTL